MAVSVYGRLERLDLLLGFEEFSNLQNKRDDMRRTFEALGLESGQDYLSIGIGRNRLPPSLALCCGLNVVGIDIDERRVEYHNSLALKFKEMLEDSNGSLKACKLNVNEDPINGHIGIYDLVECVNFRYCLN